MSLTMKARLTEKTISNDKVFVIINSRILINSYNVKFFKIASDIFIKALQPPEVSV